MCERDLVSGRVWVTTAVQRWCFCFRPFVDRYADLTRWNIWCVGRACAVYRRWEPAAHGMHYMQLHQAPAAAQAVAYDITFMGLLHAGFHDTILLLLLQTQQVERSVHAGARPYRLTALDSCGVYFRHCTDTSWVCCIGAFHNHRLGACMHVSGCGILTSVVS